MIDYLKLPLAKFAGNCLRLSIFSLHKKVVNLYISYALDTWSWDLNTELFGSVKLTTSADSDKSRYSDHDIGTDASS